MGFVCNTRLVRGDAKSRLGSELELSRLLTDKPSLLEEDDHGPWARAWNQALVDAVVAYGGKERGGMGLFATHSPGPAALAPPTSTSPPLCYYSMREWRQTTSMQRQRDSRFSTGYNDDYMTNHRKEGLS